MCDKSQSVCNLIDCAIISGRPAIAMANQNWTKLSGCERGKLRKRASGLVAEPIAH